MNEFDVELVVPKLEVVPELVDDVPPDPEPAQPTVPLEAYVLRELELTRRQFAHDPNLEERLQRCEAYARWRYAGVQSGEVEHL